MISSPFFKTPLGVGQVHISSTRLGSLVIIIANISDFVKNSPGLISCGVCPNTSYEILLASSASDSIHAIIFRYSLNIIRIRKSSSEFAPLIIHLSCIPCGLPNATVINDAIPVTIIGISFVYPTSDSLLLSHTNV